MGDVTVNASTCRHHWIIAEPGQRYSRGKCKLCKEERDFDNAPPLAYQFGSTLKRR